MRRAAVIFLMMLLTLLSGCNARWKLEKTMVEFSSSGGDVSEIVNELRISNIDFPVYIDIDDVFTESSEIPEDKRFHRFLLSENGHQVFVGNPKASKLLEELFLRACREQHPAE